MKKRLLSLFAVAAMLLSSFSAYAAVNLTDIDDYRYKNSINSLVDFGVINGYPDRSFRPENEINRAEFTTMLVASRYSESEIEACSTSDLKFPDVSSSDWFSSYVCLAVENGIIDGYPDGNFYPANNINYVESLKIIYETYDEPGKEDATGGQWYSKYLEDAEETLELDDRIVPSKNIRRGEVAKVIYAFMDVKDKGQVAESRKIVVEEYNPIELAEDDSILSSDDSWEESFTIDMEIYNLDSDYAFLYAESGISDIWNFYINDQFVKPLCRGQIDGCFIILKQEYLKEGNNEILIEKENPNSYDSWTLEYARVVPFYQGGLIFNSIYEVELGEDQVDFRFTVEGEPEGQYLLLGKVRGIMVEETDQDIECDTYYGSRAEINDTALKDGIICWDWGNEGYTESDLPDYYQYEFIPDGILKEGSNLLELFVPSAVKRDLTIEDLWIIPVE